MGNFKLSTDKKVLQSTIQPISTDYKRSLEQCRSRHKRGDVVAAFTIAPNEKMARELSKITLCDWYIESLRGEQYQIATKLELNLWRKLKDKFAVPLLEFPGGSALIDQMKLLDVTMLHELMHTFRSFFQTSPQTGPIRTGDTACPGWELCVYKKDPRNAESLAYFGLAAWGCAQQPKYWFAEDGDAGVEGDFK